MERDQWAYLKYTDADAFNRNGNYSSISSVAKPGSRYNAMSFVDNNTFYVFGGTGYGNAVNQYGELSDLWRYDGLDFVTKRPLWSWVKGDSSINSQGNYGTLGMASSSNKPSG